MGFLMTGGMMIAATAYLWKRWRKKEAVKTAATLFALVALYPIIAGGSMEKIWLGYLATLLLSAPMPSRMFVNYAHQMPAGQRHEFYHISKGEQGSVSSDTHFISKGEQGSVSSDTHFISKGEQGSVSSDTHFISKGEQGSVSSDTHFISKGEQGSVSSDTHFISKGEQGSVLSDTHFISKGEQGCLLLQPLCYGCF